MGNLQALLGTHGAALWIQDRLRGMAKRANQDPRRIHVSDQLVLYYHHRDKHDPYGLHLPAEKLGRDLVFNETELAAWFDRYVAYVQKVKPSRSITGAGFLRDWKA